MSLCDDCTNANVCCPIWYPGKEADTCVVYNKDIESEEDWEDESVN